MTNGWDATFSLVCRCPASKDLAVAVSTARLAVGSRVPFAVPGLAAIATQAQTNTDLGYAALAALRAGKNVQEAMEEALAADAGRENRQFSIIDAAGMSAVFTGSAVLARNPWAGSLRGRDCVAAGNLLAGPEVLRDMVAVFEGTGNNPGDCIGARALLALAAGQAAGGDKRGKVSAALLVVREGMEHPLLSLRVDKSMDPVQDLCVLYKECLEMFPLPDTSRNIY